MPVSFEQDIKLMFREIPDVQCMSGSVELHDYAFMSDPSGDGEFEDHAVARLVYKRLLPPDRSRRMPKNGPYWSEDQLALYALWMDDGFLR